MEQNKEGGSHRAAACSGEKERCWRPARWMELMLASGMAVAGGYVYCKRAVLPDYSRSAQFHGDRFQNVVTWPSRGFWESLGLWRDFLFNKPAGTLPDREIPVLALTQADLLDADNNSVWRLGHSTLLLKLNGKFWLTDPVFSERASPVQWFGPRRFHAPPISLEELPPIEAVVLSHNHYDHLDHAAILALQGKVGQFITPLGVGATLVAWGVPQEKVRELDWWQQTTVDGVQLVATPAQHFSGRGLKDGNRTLWASWVFRDASFNLFFSGDTGYFDGFRAIGEKYGPFDVAFLETGAYNERWKHVHMLPAQTAQAFHDLRAKWLYPIHNGTFDLSMHTWDDPFEQITHLSAEQGFALSTPIMGERVDFLAPHAGSRWWRN